MEQPKSLSDASENHRLWDCGSSLYDSFELTSFEHHLHSAIAAAPSRTMSMPHLSHHHHHHRRRHSDPFPNPNPSPSSKIARALQRLLKSVFRRRTHIRNIKTATDFIHDRAIAARDAGFYYVFYDKSGGLSSIPECSEWEGADTTPLVRKTVSDRYPVRTAFGGCESTPLGKTSSERYGGAGVGTTSLGAFYT